MVKGHIELKVRKTQEGGGGGCTSKGVHQKCNLKLQVLKHTSKRFPMLKHTSKRLSYALVQLQETYKCSSTQARDLQSNKLTGKYV